MRSEIFRITNSELRTPTSAITSPSTVATMGGTPTTRCLATEGTSAQLSCDRDNGFASQLRTPNSEFRTPNSELRTPNSELILIKVYLINTRRAIVKLINYYFTSYGCSLLSGFGSSRAFGKSDSHTTIGTRIWLSK